MVIATAAVQIIAAVLAYLSARGIDNIIGKWFAYFTIAWEKVASKNALDTYRQTRNNLVEAMPDKWKEWDEWRKNLGGKDVDKRG